MPTLRGVRSPVNAAVAREIAATRARKGLKQEDVWQRGHMARSTYIRCETNLREITVDYLFAIAKGLGTTAETIMRDVQSNSPEAFTDEARRLRLGAEQMEVGAPKAARPGTRPTTPPRGRKPKE